VTTFNVLQGTVKSFDPATRESVVLTDDRREWQVPADAFARSGLRMLTLGQRVRFRVEEGSDRVTFVNILTLPDPE
jgi:cold shock CspA family protein